MKLKCRSALFLLLCISMLIFGGCEKATDEHSVNYLYNEGDSLVYEIAMRDCHLLVEHQKLKYDERHLIKATLQDGDRQPLAGGDIKLTIVNKGRRKTIILEQIKPSIFQGVVELSFSGLSSLDFEVITKDFTNTGIVEHEISRQ